MLTERDLIMRLIRQLAEVLAAVLQLRRGGKREEALARIDQVTGRFTGVRLAANAPPDMAGRMFDLPGSGLAMCHSR